MDYRASFSVALELMQGSAQLMRGFLPAQQMQEAQNKLEAFRLFAYVDQELRFQNSRLTLRSMVSRAQALPPYQRIFALEGVAHYFTAGTSVTSGLLQDRELPETAMVPLHAGMGTAFATAALAKAGRNPSNTSLLQALDEFFGLCHANSRAGWFENSIEMMGLAVRTLHPHLLNPVSLAIGEIDINAQRLFWHGVGRSLYFVPMNFFTLGKSNERAMQAAIDEAPSYEDRLNAIAGLLWAITLVNIRHPSILRNVLRTTLDFRMPSAVTNGIVSALMVWKHMIPDDEEILGLYLRPASLMAPDATVWNEHVTLPAQQAFAEVFPALAVPNAPGQPTIASLFRYHDLAVSHA